LKKKELVNYYGWKIPRRTGAIQIQGGKDGFPGLRIPEITMEIIEILGVQNPHFPLGNHSTINNQ